MRAGSRANCTSPAAACKSDSANQSHKSPHSIRVFRAVQWGFLILRIGVDRSRIQDITKVALWIQASMKSIKSLLISALISLNCGLIAAAEKRPREVPEWDLLGGMPGEALDRKIAEMSPEHRRELIAKIKSGSIPKGIRSQLSRLLLHLGDEETIGHRADLLIRGNLQQSDVAFRELIECRDPRVIAAICPIFLHENDSELADRVLAVDLRMTNMIAETAGFSREVYAWVAQLVNLPSPMRALIFRDWWKANSAAFQRKDYMAVKPGLLKHAEAFAPSNVEPVGILHK